VRCGEEKRVENKSRRKSRLAQLVAAASRKKNIQILRVNQTDKCQTGPKIGNRLAAANNWEKWGNIDDR